MHVPRCNGLRPTAQMLRADAPHPPRAGRAGRADRDALLRRSASAALESLECRTHLAADPVAVLSAKSHASWGSIYTFKVIYRDDSAISTASIDGNDVVVSGPKGYARKASLVSITPTTDAGLVTARYKVRTPGALWDASDNGKYTITVQRNQVRDSEGNAVAQGAIGSFTVGVPTYPTDLGSEPLAPPGAVNVTKFGAIPNDGRDDTDAIQSAINSLPRGNGVPNDTLVGGTVWLPAGTFTISRPLLISSGIVLRGSGSSGSGATVLNGISTDANSSVLRFHSYFSHGFIIRAGIENLSITTATAKGLTTVVTAPGDIVGINLINLRFSTGSSAIDLRGSDVYQAAIEDVTVNDPGSTALWIDIAKSTGFSGVNRISNFNVTGAARPGFRGEKAMVVLNGDFNITGMTIGDTGARVVPLWLSGYATLRGLSLPTSAQSLGAGGVMARVDAATHVGFDKLIDASSARRLVVTNSRDVQIGQLDLADGATMSGAVSVDAPSHLTVDALYGTGDAPVENLDDVTVLSVVANHVPQPVQSPPMRNLGPASTITVDVASFGAVANDGIDDTPAIQAAIDSLPTGNGIPGGDADLPVGGTVVFGRGTFTTGWTLRVPSGVWLQGQGKSTVLDARSSDASSAAIQLVPGAAAGYNAGAGASSLNILTNAGAGIRADASITSGLVDLHLTDLQISAGGAAIDLRAVKTYHTRIEHISINNTGSTALWIGDSAGYSADNFITGVQMAGTTRANFRAEKALFVFAGQNTVENVWIEQANANVLPMSISGNMVMRGTWLEYPAEHVPNRTMLSLENVHYADIDRLLSIDNARKIRMRNATGVHIGFLNIAGRTGGLSDSLDMDSVSRLAVDTVQSIRDSGMLDHPQVTVGANYNQSMSAFVPTVAALNGPNLLGAPSTWTVQWGDTFGAVQGRATVENTASGPRLRIDITSNPNNRPVAVRMRINVSDTKGGADNTSPTGFARWRIDGPNQAIVWTSNFQQQYANRAMNSLTAAPVLGDLRLGGELVVQLSGTGTYYLSNFAVVPG